jgi:hypothetical protein
MSSSWFSSSSPEAWPEASRHRLVQAQPQVQELP